MKKITETFLIALCLCNTSFLLAEDLPCTSTKSTSFGKDIVRNQYVCLKTDVTYKTSDCKTVELQITDTLLDISAVYQIGFYIKNQQNVSLQISFLSENTWSSTTTLNCLPSTGKRQFFAFSPLSLGANVDYKKIKKIKIEIQSEEDVYLDELSFQFMEPEKKQIAIGYEPKRLKNIKKKFEENAKQDAEKLEANKKRDFDFR